MNRAVLLGVVAMIVFIPLKDDPAEGGTAPGTAGIR